MDSSVSNNAFEYVQKIAYEFKWSHCFLIIQKSSKWIQKYLPTHTYTLIYKYFFSKIGIGNMNTNAKSNFAVMGSSLKLNSLSSCLVKMQAHTIQHT